MNGATVFAIVTGALAALTGGLLVVQLLLLREVKWSTESALKQVQALKTRHPEARVEDYLSSVGKLPASKYSDELDKELFGITRRVVVQVPIDDDPFSHVRVPENVPREYAPSEAKRLFLTDRERRILQLLVEGDPMSAGELARRLAVSNADVRKIVSDIISRLSELPT